VTDYLDGCPACLLRDNPPINTITDKATVVCDYKCAACGTPWTTSWWDSDAVPLPGQPAVSHG